MRESGRIAIAPARGEREIGAVKRQRIVIIGGGFSGAALALELVNTTGARVTVIDRFGGFGRGLAYSTQNPAHFLNVHAERMSVLPDAPDDFWNWLRERGHNAPRDAYAPRKLYGDYLGQRLNVTGHFAAPDSLKLVHDEAVSCRVTTKLVRIGLASGKAIVADRAILALGNLAAAAPFDASALDASRYIASPWDAEALAQIAPTEDVLLVGAGLTMLDTALALTRAPRTGKLFALSRRGLIPRSQAETHGAPIDLERLPAELSDLLHRLRREARDAIARGGQWQDVMNAMRPKTQPLWRRWPVETRMRFLRHARIWWDVHRHRAPPYAAGEIEALKTSGALSVLAGKIMSAEPRDGGVRVTWRPRGSHEPRTLDVARIVNCTGSSVDINRSQDALIKQLLADGVARPHATGLGFDINAGSELINSKGVPSSRLHAIGPLTTGGFWEITAVPEIRRRAHEIAQSIVHASVTPQT